MRNQPPPHRGTSVTARLVPALLVLLPLHLSTAWPQAGATLDLDSAHVLAARATGFGFTLREVSYPAKCEAENQLRGNSISFALQSDRSVAWADIVCEHKVFENRALQNGWTLLRFELKHQCLTRDAGNWKPVADDSCDVQVTRPVTAGPSLATSVRARLRGSGPLAARERRLEMTYHFTITGPPDRSPWSAQR